MPNPIDNKTRLYDYISGIIDRRLTPVTLSLSNSVGFLRGLATSSATAASNAASSAVAALEAFYNFDSLYIGRRGSDPIVTNQGRPLALGAFYIRSTDDRLRYVSAITPNLVWRDATVYVPQNTAGLLTITGINDTAGVRLSNNNSSQDIRIIQKNDGNISIFNITSGFEIFYLTSNNGFIRGNLIWHAGNDGTGSGMDSDLLRGSHWTSGHGVLFGQTSAITPPGAGSTGGFCLRARTDNTVAVFQILNNDATAQWGHWAYNAAGNAEWYGTGGLRSGTNTVWHGGNDGSGSGLDADIWRGLSPDQLIDSLFSSGSNANGTWKKSPASSSTSWLTQYARDAGSSAQGAATILFPVPFADTNYDLQLTPVISSAGDFDNFVQEINGTRTVNGVQVFFQDPSSGGSGALAGFNWRAEGLAP